MPADPTLLPNYLTITNMEQHPESLTTPEVAAGQTPAVKPEPLTKAQILSQMAEIAEKDAADITREEVNRLKLLFYNLRHEEVAAQKREFLASGAAEEEFTPAADPDEETFKAAYQVIKDKKAALAAEQEAERLENLARKNAIIDEIVAAAAEADTVHQRLDRVRELQQQFKEIGEVPAPQVSDLWKRYQQATETFYDQLKVNKDLRDLDFKKNLESKSLIVVEAAKLVEEPDVVLAFRRLQELHDKWREIGPVAKEFREEIWAKFKDLSAEINKRYQAHFEERKAMERQNEEQKLALIEKLEAIKPEEINGFSAWDEATKQVIALQEQWKQLGFASRKANTQLYQRFRSLCDAFFAAKATHYKSVKEEGAENLAKKISLCERAEELAESTDWKKTADLLVELQAEWKKIGAVPRKQSDAVWARFRAACDKFFDSKKQNSDSRRSSESANLKAKREVIAKLEAIADDGGDRKGAIARVRELMSEYQAIGHVPFRDKDKLHDAYRAQVSRLYELLDMSGRRGAMAAFTAGVGEMTGSDLSRQRQTLTRQIEAKRNEIKTYENNLGFLSSRSKSGQEMLRDMERRIERLRQDLKTLEEKLKLIDSKDDANA